MSHRRDRTSACGRPVGDQVRGQASPLLGAASAAAVRVPLERVWPRDRERLRCRHVWPRMRPCGVASEVTDPRGPLLRAVA